MLDLNGNKKLDAFDVAMLEELRKKDSPKYHSWVLPWLVVIVSLGGLAVALFFLWCVIVGLMTNTGY